MGKVRTYNVSVGPGSVLTVRSLAAIVLSSLSTTSMAPIMGLLLLRRKQSAMASSTGLATLVALESSDTKAGRRLPRKHPRETCRLTRINCISPTALRPPSGERRKVVGLRLQSKTLPGRKRRHKRCRRLTRPSIRLYQPCAKPIIRGHPH